MNTKSWQKFEAKMYTGKVGIVPGPISAVVVLDSIMPVGDLIRYGDAIGWRTHDGQFEGKAAYAQLAVRFMLEALHDEETRGS